jgi:CubicO group peptidase (beta-lactamase class C family)
MVRILCFLLLLNCSSCYMIRAYKVRKFQLTDPQRMPYVSIAPSTTPYYFKQDTTENRYRDIKKYLDTSLPKSHTAAFLVIKNDSIIYERYFNGFTQQSKLPSFSVAKSFVSTLVAVALMEGKINSLQDPITKYIPELYQKDQRYERITLQHLLDMKSGLHFNEGSYGLKDDAIKLGFRPNIFRHVLKVKIDTEPGKKFRYQSINTELLAIAVQRATGKKVAPYLQETLWQTLGAEFEANWNVDSKRHKQEIAFAGLNATARDFAKLGQLFIQKGQWQGKQILSPSWVSRVNNADSMEQAGGYKNQWWSELSSIYFKDSLSADQFRRQTPHSDQVNKTTKGYQVRYRTDAFNAEGILNQFIYINPNSHVVIVRLGRYWYHPSMYANEFIYNLGNTLSSF